MFSTPDTWRVQDNPRESLIVKKIERKQSKTLPDFLSWSVLSCLSFSRTLQILAMAHVGSQVGVSCVPSPGAPPTELIPGRWAHRRPSQLPGSTHRGYRGDTGLGERGAAAVLPEQKHLCNRACTLVALPPSCSFLSCSVS